MNFLSLLRGCTGSSEPTHVKIPHCWKSHVTAQMQVRLCLHSRITILLGIRRPDDEPSAVTVESFGDQPEDVFLNGIDSYSV